MSDRIRSGMEQGRKMLGSRWDRICDSLRDVDPRIAEHLIGFAYGEVYPRPGLDLRSRELVAVTALTLQGLGPQLRTHVHAALDAGVGEDELMELFLHLALYAGFPTALFGATEAREVIRRRREKAEQPGTEASPEPTGGSAP